MKIPFTKAHGAKNDFLFTWRRDAPEPGAKNPHEAYFFYGVPFGQWTGAQLEAVRAGPWKLMLPHTYRTLGDSPPGRSVVQKYLGLDRRPAA